MCDINRPVDVDDVFEKLDATEQAFEEFFRPTISSDDGIDEEGRKRILEIITGICDYGGGIDDCVMYTVCSEGGVGSGCDVSQGQAFHNAGGEATHAAFVPFLPEGNYWWIVGNRYGNLQHEFTHLLDYTYFRVDGYRGTDLNWWREGLAQFVQWKLLGDRLSWNRGNDDARLLEIFTHRWNTSDYYDGMRIFAFLEEFAPYLIDEAAKDVRMGIYRTTESHLAWHNLLGYIASRHQDLYDQWTESAGEIIRNRVEPHVDYDLPGLIEHSDFDNEGVNPR